MIRWSTDGGTCKPVPLTMTLYVCDTLARAPAYSQHTSAYVSIRQHTCVIPLLEPLHIVREKCELVSSIPYTFMVSLPPLYIYVYICMYVCILHTFMSA